MRIFAGILNLLLASAAIAADGDPVAEPMRFAFSTGAAGMPAGQVLQALDELSSSHGQFDVDRLIAHADTRNVVISLVNADAAMARQALAHAMGCWWAWAPAVPGSGGWPWVLTVNRHLPLAPVTVRWTTSTLRLRPVLESEVERLLEPWLGGHAGLAYQEDTALWPATLDADGHAQLAAILGIIGRPEAQCPSRVADPDLPDLDRHLDAPLSAATWGAFADALARRAGICVALGPGLRADGAVPLDLRPGSLGELPGAIAGLGAHAAFRHGVLCIEASAPAADIPDPDHTESGIITDREHPGSRRRLAVIPLGRLAADDAAGALLVADLTANVDPGWWKQPGADLVYLNDAHALLAAADPDTLQDLLDAIDAVERRPH